MTTELKPCPFCGGPAANIFRDDITCGSPGIACPGADVQRSVAAWNQRSPDPLVEGLERIVDSLKTMVIKSQAAYTVLAKTFNEACITYPNLDAADLRLVMRHMLLEAQAQKPIRVPADGGVNVH